MYAQIFLKRFAKSMDNGQKENASAVEIETRKRQVDELHVRVK